MQTLKHKLDFSKDMFLLWVKGLKRLSFSGSTSYVGITRYFYGKDAKAQKEKFEKSFENMEKSLLE